MAGGTPSFISEGADSSPGEWRGPSSGDIIGAGETTRAPFLAQEGPDGGQLI